MYIHRSRVPLPEVYRYPSDVWRTPMKLKYQASRVVPALGEVEVGWIAVLPGPGNLGSRPVFEKIGRCVAKCAVLRQYPQPDPMDGVLTVLNILTRCSLMDNHPLAGRHLGLLFGTA